MCENFQIQKNIRKRSYICAIKFLTVQNDHIYFPAIYGTVELQIRTHPQIFPWQWGFSIFYVLSIWTWSSSGWVLMDLKVLPSKSVEPGEYFEYPQCYHISYSFWNIYIFLPKTPSRVSYIWMHHLMLRFQNHYLYSKNSYHQKQFFT